ncbi:hypothetical protein TRVL_02388 [Trypanosoma vivax]|uniref:Phosphoribulokinase/uridine kinase domain-containing protein n=1 Tax=Trypanosoma vivax (strain Y486) TaxID=1055687 RepID=G0TVL2_TRYVY|nr:hypothetical protein TRVL_02388 [Trypanosoma vivax]CCC47978.1 conserved hypothetical protein [Trypanosoma vivax Y486]
MNKDGGAEPNMQSCVTLILDKYKRTPQRRILVGIGGRPGSGKTTFAQMLAAELRKQIPIHLGIQDADSAVAIMSQDGYHLYREELLAMPSSAKALERRGAEWTFNARKLCRDLQAIRLPAEVNPHGDPPVQLYDDVYVPSFDHAAGDPVEWNTLVPGTAVVVILEGNYVLYCGTPLWAEVRRSLDVTIFLDCDATICAQRLCDRHMAAWGITVEEAMRRATGSDAVNGSLVEKTRGEADIVLKSVGHRPIKGHL